MTFSYIIKIENNEDLEIATNLIENEQLECFIISTEINADKFIKQAKNNKKIVLCDGETEDLIEYYKNNSLDGIIINIQDSYKIKKDINTIREKLNKDAFIGAKCHISRH